MIGHRLRSAPHLHTLAAAVAAIVSLARPEAAQGAMVGMMPTALDARAVHARGGIFGTLTKRAAASAATATSVPALVASSSVTSCADDGGSDTLRYAVLTASEGGTVHIDALPCSKITLGKAIDVFFDNLTIEGPGAGKLTVDGGGIDRVFKHAGKGTLELKSITVAGGKIEGDKVYGGCVYSRGNVTLTGAVVTSCQATGQAQAVGGGVFAYDLFTAESSTISDNVVEATAGATKTPVAAGGGVFAHELTLKHSTVSGNIAHASGLGSGEGAGAAAYAITSKYSTITGNDAISIGDTYNYSAAGGLAAFGTLFMLSSTVDHNAADIAGGIFIGDSGYGFATIVQSTISANDGRLSIGGIGSGAPLALGNCTVAFNTGGIFGGGGAGTSGTTATLQSTILADNTPSDLDGTAVLDGGNNIIKIKGPYAGALPPMTSTLDPDLGPLAYNGGVTRTHALKAGSPAIDGGNNVANAVVDQRGPTYARVVGAAPDIGAVEFDDDHVFGDVFGS